MQNLNSCVPSCGLAIKMASPSWFSQPINIIVLSLKTDLHNYATASSRNAIGYGCISLSPPVSFVSFPVPSLFLYTSLSCPFASPVLFVSLVPLLLLFPHPSCYMSLTSPVPHTSSVPLFSCPLPLSCPSFSSYLSGPLLFARPLTLFYHLVPDTPLSRLLAHILECGPATLDTLHSSSSTRCLPYIAHFFLPSISNNFSLLMYSLSLSASLCCCICTSSSHELSDHSPLWEVVSLSSLSWVTFHCCPGSSPSSASATVGASIFRRCLVIFR